MCNNAVLKSFKGAMNDLAKRSLEGDENVSVQMLGYAQANPSITPDELIGLFEKCLEELKGNQTVDVPT